MMGNRRRFHRRSGGTHTEDVQAHRPFNALLVGEVVLGELVNGCGENTHRLGRVGCRRGLVGSRIKARPPRPDPADVTP